MTLMLAYNNTNQKSATNKVNWTISFKLHATAKKLIWLLKTEAFSRVEVHLLIDYFAKYFVNLPLKIILSVLLESLINLPIQVLRQITKFTIVGNICIPHYMYKYF